MLQGVTLQCLEFFIFVMEGSGKKQKRRYEVTSYTVRSVHEIARHMKIRIKYNILISGKLPYPAHLWSRRWQIAQILV
jgi:hypothetical protein